MQGPSGIVFVGFVSGPAITPTSNTAFLGSTLRITIAAGQSFHLTASQAFGSTIGAARLDIFPCYKRVGGPLVRIGLGIFDLTALPGQRSTFTVTGVASPSAGTYDVGMCGDDDGNGKWNFNEFGYVSVIVTN